MVSQPFRICLFVLALTANSFIANTARAQTPPTPDFIWNNFVGANTAWSTANNWAPGGPPTSSNDRVLGFTSSSLQTAQGYAVTFDQNAFDVNSLVFTSQASSGTSINVLLGTLAGQRLQFNTSSSAVLPSIWQMGSGSVTFTNGQSLVGMTLMNATNLQILGNGIGNLNLNANIVELGGSSGLTINQTGTRPNHTGSQVRLGGGNTFTGGVTLTAGNLVIASNSALGTGTFTVNTAPGAGSLRFDPASLNPFTINNNIQLNQTLVITGQNTAATTPSPIATFAGTISGPGGITFNNVASGMTYAFQGNNDFTGAVTIAPRGNTANNIFLGTATDANGTMTGASSFTVNYNALLRFNNTLGVVTRLNTTTAPTLTLNAGNFQLYGNATANSSETFGNLTVSGQGAIAVLGASNTAQTSALTFSGLTRNANGTLFFTATSLGSNMSAGKSIIRFTADPGGAIGGGGGVDTTTRSILPYAVASYGASTATVAANINFGFVRWDSATQQIVPLNQTTEYASNLYATGTTAPTANHRYASTAALPNAFGVAGVYAPTTINSLILDTNTTATNRIGVSLAGSSTLTVESGAIGSTVNGSTGAAPSIPSMINVGELRFGLSNPGYVHTFANLIVNSTISGNAGLVKSGTGVLQLNGTNNFTGGLTVNAGLVQFSSNDNLGNAAAPIVLNGGLGGGIQLLSSNLYGPTSLSTVNLNRSINVLDGGGVINVGTANTNLIVSGVISGPGQIFKNGAGVLTLTGSNTFTGGLTAFSGTINVGSHVAMGPTSNDLILAGGTLQTTGTFTTDRNMLLTASSVLFNPDAGSNLTISGNLTSQVPGISVLKDGPGDVTFTAVNTLLGSYQNGISGPAVRGTSLASTTNSGRTILAGPNGSMPLAASIFAIGNGEFVLDNSAAVNNNRIGTVAVSVIGGGFRVMGNTSASVTESIGAISFSNASNPYGGTITLETPIGSGQSTTVHAQALSANATLGTVFIRGTGLGAGSGDRSALILGSQTGLQVNGLIPSLVGATSATAEPTDFLTTQTIVNAAPNANQFSLIPFTGYTAGTGALGAGAAANTYDVTAPSSFGPGASAANALRISGTTLDLGAGTLTIGAAHVLSTGGSAASISNGTLAFGALPARFTVTSGSDLTVSATTTGTAGMIKSGLGVLTLNAASTITPTANGFGIAQGTLRYGVADALPTGTMAFINAGATLDINGTTSTLGSFAGYGNVALGNGTLTFGGAFQGNSTTTPTTPLAFGGSFSGTGALIKTGTALFTASGDSSGYSGQVSILNGTLTLNSNTGIGTGPILLGDTVGTNQALLTLGTSVTNFSNNITVQAGGSTTAAHRITTSTGMNTISGNIAINNTNVLGSSGGISVPGIGLDLRGTTGAAGGITTQTGVISGPGGIYVFSGNWTFSGNNTYAGGTLIDTTTAGSVGIGIDSTPTSGTVTSGPFGSGAVSFSTGFGSNLRAIGGARTIGNQINLSATGGYFGVTGTNNLTLNGPVDLQGATIAQTFVITNTAMTTINGTIQNGTGGVVKNGPGALSLTGNNTYTGTTVVNAGTLLVNNTSGNATQTVTVNSGAVLGGSGSVGGNLVANTGAIVSPGNSTGILTVNGAATLASGSTLSIEINGNTAGTLYDQLNVAGAIDVTGATLEIRPFQNPEITDFYFIARSTGVTGTFAGLPQGATYSIPGFSATISYVGNAGLGTETGGNDIVLFAPTPEPGTVLFASVFTIGAIGYIRRRVRNRMGLATAA
jgi:fibronectin-binding autotransporter adhesin